ncbi:unnamed protein product [Pneumocystis jirovecii]|uniref:Large ribosomal subunit protein uL6 alpha-beta domain-containing protein n=1 Tax=Pneumocystis jirovecii TaxID=42068 RepID=L0PDB4_PNEJI|nr:unnamed protein product [Pneumocystis jirovecii]
MKDIYKQVELALPPQVSVGVKARIVRVTGPRGELTKSFRHVNIDIRHTQQRRLVLGIWHGGKKHVACLRTVRSLIKNMVVGVTQGYRYKVREKEGWNGAEESDAVCIRTLSDQCEYIGRWEASRNPEFFGGKSSATGGTAGGSDGRDLENTEGRDCVGGYFAGQCISVSGIDPAGMQCEEQGVLAATLQLAVQRAIRGGCILVAMAVAVYGDDYDTIT